MALLARLHDRTLGIRAGPLSARFVHRALREVCTTALVGRCEAYRKAVHRRDVYSSLTSELARPRDTRHGRNDPSFQRPSAHRGKS